MRVGLVITAVAVRYCPQTISGGADPDAWQKTTPYLVMHHSSSPEMPCEVPLKLRTALHS